MKVSCSSRIGRQEATDQIAKVAPHLRLAIRALINAMPHLRVYSAHYPYAKAIIGRRSKTDMYSKFLPPCFGSERMCGACQEITAATNRHRPLIIVLGGAVEEYFSVTRVGQHQNSELRIPYAVSWPGDTAGLVEALNVLTITGYGEPPRLVFENPLRRMTSGSQNIFFTISLQDQRLAKFVKRKEIIAPEILNRFFPGASRMSPLNLAERLQQNHSTFFEMLCAAAKTSWHTSLLVIPLDQLRPPLTSRQGGTRDFVFELLKQGWRASRGSRSNHIRQLALYEAMSSENHDLYAEVTAHHILNLGRGDLPGFAPPNEQFATGPFAEIQEFLGYRGFRKFGMKHFPSILQPVHLGKTAKAVYYSFQNPTLLAPSAAQKSRALTQGVKSRVDVAQENSPDLAPNVEFTFFQASGRPRIPSISTFRTKRQLSPEIKEDFADEIKRAKRLWGIEDDIEFFPGGKKGFMSRFVRIALRDNDRDRDAKAKQLTPE